MQRKMLKSIARKCTFIFLCVLFLKIQQSTSDIIGPVITLEPLFQVELRRLRSDLLDHYDKASRPVKKLNQSVTVRLFYDVRHVVSMDENSQVLSVNGQLTLFWRDDFLKWDPSSYSGIISLRMSPDEIWWPPIKVEYNVKPLALDEKGYAPAITVGYDGSVRWLPQLRCDVPCSANYKHYPFDSHECLIVFLTQSFNYTEVELLPYSPREKTNISPGTEWTVKEVTQDSVVYLGYLSMTKKVKVRILLERLSGMYRYVCVIPTFISMTTLLFGFWLLPSETSRYIVGCGNVIVLSLLLQHMVMTVPAGSTVPLLAQYSASCLGLSAIFIVLSVITNVLRECNGTAPRILVRLSHFKLDRCLCIFTFSHVASEDRVFNDCSTTSRSGRTVTSGSLSPDEIKRRKEWHTVSILVDRIFFWLYACAFVVLISVLAAI